MCLLEEALGPDIDAPARRLIVHLPLAQTPSGSVFLVRQETPSTGLLRLKTWHRTAPADYLVRFHDLREALIDAAESTIVAPLAVSVAADGRPSVLTEFRRGVPVLAAVASGAVSARAAAGLLGPVRDVLCRVRANGLAHGSIVSGNVMVRPDLKAAFLVDFGLSALLRPHPDPSALASEDDAALDALIEAL